MEVQFYINTIKNMMRVQKIAATDEIEVISRHMSDLEDYLYEQELADQSNELSDIKQLFHPPWKNKDGRFSDKNSAKRFDYLDFVIIDTPATIMPWQDRSR